MGQFLKNNFWKIISFSVLKMSWKNINVFGMHEKIINIYCIIREEDKIWDKAWRAQQAHVHEPMKGQAHSLCGAPDRTRAKTCPPRFRFLKTCFTRRRLALQEEDLLCKDKTGPTRRRLALQGKEQRPHYYKSPNILLTWKVRVTDSFLAL